VRRHELDLFSLLAGLVFVAVAVGHLLDVAVDLDVDGRYVAPVALVVIGVVSLAGVLRSSGRTTEPPTGSPSRNETEEVAGDTDAR
jgi:hypothetical protein